MPKSPAKAKFKTTLVNEPPGSGWHFLRIDAKIGEKFEKKEGSRRVICSINGQKGFQCALMPSGDTFYIMVSKAKREKFGVEGGETITVELTEDGSKYGAPMPAELKEVLRQDAEGRKLFEALTAGQKRSIMFYVGKVKDIDVRIHTALVFLQHLKDNDGKLVREQLTKDLKRPAIQ